MRILSHPGLCEKHRKLLVMLTIVFLLSTLFTSQSAAVHVHISCIEPKNIGDNTEEHDGYIIQFKEEPLSVFMNELKNRIRNVFSYLTEAAADNLITQKIAEYKDKLLTLHRGAKEDILNLLGKTGSSEKIFSRGFIHLFNGISIKNVEDNFVEKIKDLPYVDDVVPNYRISTMLDESVPLINADDVWNMQDASGRNITGEGVTIAIIDTGVDYNHPDLKDNYLGGYDFGDEDTDPMDNDGHGTHCAGIAVGRGNDSNYQYVGVAPDAKFYAYKVFRDEEELGLDSWAIAAMEEAVNAGVDIISLSLGSEEPGDPRDPLSVAADNAVDAGVVVVAAAGNNGTEGAGTIRSPGCARKVICVGSTTKDDVIDSSSSMGPVEWDGNYIVKPDVVAPGVWITSTKNDGGYTAKSGTSMATPHVAGATALLLQAHPEWTPDKIKQTLKDTAVDLGYDCNTQGGGRIDVLQALSTNNSLFIDAPNEIFEGKYFTVNISDDSGNPETAFVLFIVPYHLPQIRYGSSVKFKAPRILNPFTESLDGKLIVLKLVRRQRVSTTITVANEKFSFYNI